MLIEKCCPASFGVKYKSIRFPVPKRPEIYPNLLVVFKIAYSFIKMLVLSCTKINSCAVTDPLVVFLILIIYFAKSTDVLSNESIR